MKPKLQKMIHVMFVIVTKNVQLHNVTKFHCFLYLFRLASQKMELNHFELPSAIKFCAQLQDSAGETFNNKYPFETEATSWTSSFMGHKGFLHGR